MTALQELLAKVEAGTVSHVGKKAKWPDFDFEGKGYGYHVNANMALAYNGSLDAAKSLHEAVLHGWDVSMGTGHAGTFEAGVATGSRIEIFNGTSGVMSRAWLIAIIKALIAQEATT